MPKGIATLQSDALYAIFEEAIRQSLGRPSLREAPLNLSQTCHSWREILLNNGRFWTNLQIFSVKSYDARMMLTWLERSRDAPISVRFGFLVHTTVNTRDGSQKDALYNMVKIAMLQQTRLSSVTFDRWSPDLEGVSSPFEVHNLAELTELVFQHPYPFAINMKNSWIKKSVVGDPLFLLTLLPNSQQPIAPSLRKLIIALSKDEAAQQAGLLAMLRQCPNLKEFRFSTRGPRDFSTVPVHPSQSEEDAAVCLNLLQILSVNIVQYNHFLRLIRVPNLRCLRVEAMLHSTSSPVAKDVLHLVADGTASTSLREAHLCFEQIDEEDQCKLLHAMPEITTLESNFIQSRHAYEQLSLEYDGGRLCPKLEKLDVTVQPEDLEFMQQVLLSRFTRIEEFHAWILIGDPARENNRRYEFPSPLEKYQIEGRLNGERISSHIGLCFPVIDWGWCGTGKIMQEQTIMRFRERGY